MVHFTPLEMLFVLLAAHCFFDYAGQGDFMAQAKNPTTQMGAAMWRWVLPSHGLIHGGAVFLITGSLWLGVAEACFHTATDYAKCRNWITYSADQTIHIVCKVAYIFILAITVQP